MPHVFAHMLIVAVTSMAGLERDLRSEGPAPATPRPNVVLIMTDDQGFGDFGSTGNPVIETPNLDRWSRQCISFNQFYVSPVCSPTRACLMTGRYNYRTRCIDTWIGRSMMEPEELTLAELLQQNGYRTGIFGKWHLGDCFPMRAMDQGFESSLVHRGGGLAQASEPPENRRRYTDPILFRNGVAEQAAGFCTDVYFDEAVRFIEDAQSRHQPFFAYIPTNAPHGPFHDVPADWLNHYRDKIPALQSLIVARDENRRRQLAGNLPQIAAMISNIDANVGRLLRFLEERELAENTIVIFLVDNGPNSRRFVGQFRGMKSEVYEGGVRSPLWIRWPARFDAPCAVEPWAAHIDILPTVAEMCGVALPADLCCDGRSLLPLMQNPAAAWPSRYLVVQSHRGDVPARYHHFMIRDDRWKLVHPSGFGQERFSGPPRFELYDLTEDVGETRNLASQRGEIVARLKTEYDRWFDDVSSTRPDNYEPPRIVIGSTREPVTVLTRQDWRRQGPPGTNRGIWHVNFQESGEFDFLVDCGPEPDVPVLTFADRKVVATEASSREGEPAEKWERTRYVFRGIDVTEGPVNLCCRMQNSGQGAYQVTVRPAAIGR